MADQNRDWKKGKLFWIKNIQKTNDIMQEDKVDKVLITGLYLDDLVAMPWFMLTEAYFFSTTIKEHYYGDGKRYLVYDPVIIEVEKYLQKIRRYMKVNVLSVTVPDYKKQNIQIQKMFQTLNSQIRETERKTY